MDIKSFAENDFHPKRWINKAWSSSGNQEKEVFVANAVSRLQLYMKQLTNSLDDASTHIVMTLPRVMNEAAGLQDDGTKLHHQLVTLKQTVQGVEEQTGQSIQSLQRIDKLKSKLENAASTLHEADKWAALTSALETILESGVPSFGKKLTDLSNQVTAMTQSLEVLCDASDYDSKQVQLETLYNRLEAVISPPFIDALTQMDPERTATYVALFRGMGRKMSVCRCWRRAAAARLAAAWHRLDAHSVSALTRLLTQEAGKQIDWLTNVLKSDCPLAELVRLYTDLMLSLEPSPTKLAIANLKLCANAEEGILFLTDLRDDIDQFVATINSIVNAPRPVKDPLNESTEREFGRAAYAPLRELLPKYTELQIQGLLKHLDNIDLKQEDLVEYARAILNVADQCEGWFEAAYARSKKIAGIAAYPYYVPAVEKFISVLASLISAHSRRVETEFLTSVSAGKATGVLSEVFTASLMLGTATATLLNTLAVRHQAESEEPEPKELTPLRDLVTLLLEAEGRQRLAAFLAEPPLSVITLRRIKEHLNVLSKNILKEPVETQLESIASLPVWNNNDALTTELPDFALSPQEYITEIGQYLMTLPQHLEMHMPEKQAPWQFLSEVCIQTCEIYAQKILTIRNMDELGTKRCLTDIVYLSSVVEDLGTSITPALKSLEGSLRTAIPTHPPHGNLGRSNE